MCQQWVSVAGLAFELVGFLVIAYEWRRVFEMEMHRRMLRIEEDYKKAKAWEKGEELPDPSAMDFTMWREFIKLWRKEKQHWERLFYSGVILVVLGFIFQLLGSLPGGIFGIKTC